MIRVLRLFPWLAFLFCSLSMAGNELEPYQKPKFRPMTDHQWIDRSWSYGYFMVWYYNWNDLQSIAKKLNGDRNSAFGSFEEYIDSAESIFVAKDEMVNIAIIEFDKQGYVLSKNSFPGKWRVGLQAIGSFALYDSSKVSTKIYTLAQRFEGLGDVSTHWAPAWCDLSDIPTLLTGDDALYIYNQNFKPSPGSRTFGCREWAYQLYDINRPYIDVTSYSPKDTRYPAGTYIREFIGWARFGDLKPVIGKHGKQWFCLHDCPDNEKPGPIPNIQLWAARHGWESPLPPERMPMFPDPKREELEEVD